MQNLNNLQIDRDDRDYDASEFERNHGVDVAKATVLFDGLEQRLIEEIGKSHMVLGCVAWLTSKSIITALTRPNVQIVVQKEDFLRPDTFDLPDYKAKIRGLYEGLHCKYERSELLGKVNHLIERGVPEPRDSFNYGRFSLSYSHDPEVEPVRCFGNHNSEKHPAFPRMHHKFVILFQQSRRLVWTGSFNFTYNATQSLENALILSDKQIVSAYLQEWRHIFALSEPLDWESEWVAPEYRLGT